MENILDQSLDDKEIMINELLDKNNWDTISCIPNLSQEFIYKYVKKLNWNMLSTNQYLSMELINDYCDFSKNILNSNDVNLLGNILRYQNISNEFIMENVIKNKWCIEENLIYSLIMNPFISEKLLLNYKNALKHVTRNFRFIPNLRRIYSKQFMIQTMECFNWDDYHVYYEGHVDMDNINVSLIKNWYVIGIYAKMDKEFLSKYNKYINPNCLIYNQHINKDLKNWFLQKYHKGDFNNVNR